MKLFAGIKDIIYKKIVDKEKNPFFDINKVSHIKNKEKNFFMKILKKKRKKENLLISEEINKKRNLDNPKIIKLIDFFETDKKYYCFFEFFQMENLETFLKKNNLKKKEKIKIFLQICKLINFLHKKQIFIYILNLENIFIDKNLEIKINIYDLLKKKNNENFNFEKENKKYYFLAPEIYFEKKNTKKTDIWNLGILSFFIFTGKFPFEEKSKNKIIDKILKNKIFFEEDFCEKIKTVILNLLSIEPSKRKNIEHLLKNRIFLEFLNLKNNNYFSVEEKNSRNEKKNFLKSNTNYFSKKFKNDYGDYNEDNYVISKISFKKSVSTKNSLIKRNRNYSNNFLSRNTNSQSIKNIFQQRDFSKNKIFNEILKKKKNTFFETNSKKNDLLKKLELLNKKNHEKKFIIDYNIKNS